MKKTLFLAIFLLPLNLFALELKVGDILLQPLKCWSCSLIEAQEETIYSHVGMVIETEPEVLVAEALGSVRILSLKEFNARTEEGQKLAVRRLRHSKALIFLQKNKNEFQAYFKEHFEGLDYDHDFRWDNLDENGNEKLYCSEFISKIMTGFVGLDLPRKEMRFDVNREGWLRYFKGNPPDGLRGNSPGDLERSSLYYEVGEL